LALILEGDSAGDIARTLCISEHTVQGYVKVLLSKTKSRNRPAMVAKVLNWNQVRTDEHEDPVPVKARARKVRIA
jgi:DNA-binding NarL/FixJ family response regulator